MSDNNSKRLATVDAVSGSIIRATMSLDARGTPVMGQYAVLHSDGDLLLCRITKVDLINPVHENPTFAPYIMAHGAVPQWSGEVDIERAEVEIVSMIDAASHKRIPRRRNPSSGTAIEAATQRDLSAFLNESYHTSVCLGYIPNSGGLVSTIINRHHGKWEDGGYGEARHTGVFGQNGSGKTVLATMIIVGKLSAHPEMGLLMPDTAGDIADPTRHNRGSFLWNYVEVLKRAAVDLEIIEIGDIRLTSRATLKGLLGPFLKRHMSMDVEKAATLSGRIVETIFEKKVDSAKLTADAVLEQIVEHIGFVYAKSTRSEKTDDAKNLATTPGRRRPFDRDLEKIRKFFDGREELGHLIRDVLERGRKVIIKMGTAQLNEQDQSYVMREVMSELSWRAKIVFTGNGSMGRSCNALVVLDEAARWVPQGGRGGRDDGDDAAIAEIVTRAFRETRKYGLGWMVIAQRPSAIDKNVLSECHTKWFGRGLGIGADRKHIEDILGKDGVESYDQLEVQGGYFWVASGMDNNIGTEGTYFTLDPFGGDATTAFIEANPHIFGNNGTK